MNDKSNQVSVLALNPAVDISYIIPQLLEYQKVLAEQTLYHPGGNGINIARALTELDVPAHCCSVIAGESGDLLLKLLADILDDRHTWFRVDGETRINTTIMQQNPPGLFEITSFGPEIRGDVVKDFCDCMLEHTGTGIGVVSGLIPPSVPETTYAEVIQGINDQGGKAVVDARPNVLTHAIEAKPWMVRVNRHRLERLMNQVLDNVGDVADAARWIQQQGIEYVCITLGDNGAVLIDSDNSYHGDAPRIHKQSTVGCGDSTITGLIASSLKGETSQEMLRFGIMCASATASLPGTELFKASALESWDIDIEITALDR